jgi:hypothetical protein
MVPAHSGRQGNRSTFENDKTKPISPLFSTRLPAKTRLRASKSSLRPLVRGSVTLRAPAPAAPSQLSALRRRPAITPQAVHTLNGTEQYVYNPSNQRVWKQEARGEQ